jgi:hypothetical protein
MKPGQKKEDKVYKALDEEEKTILGNIAALVSELQKGGEQPVAESKNEDLDDMDDKGKKVEMADKPKDDEEAAKAEDDGTGESEEAEKALETTPSDGPTASDDAEDRIDETPSEQTEENVNEVAKQLASLLMGVKKAKKVHKSTNPLVSTMQDMAEGMKVLKAENQVLGEAMTKLLDGIGVTEQLNVVRKAEEEARKSKPVTNPDMQRLVEFLQSNVRKSEDEESQVGASNSEVIHKNLGGVAASLFGSKR